MDGFNGKILVDKITKLNSSQHCIETLSNWCIFHRQKCKQIVGVWEQQFYSGSLEKQIQLLYLANDILQNSRRKGVEYVTEFCRILPDALDVVVKYKDEAASKIVYRLINIWDERNVFGTLRLVLKGEVLSKVLMNKDKDVKRVDSAPNQPSSDMIEKVISSCENVYNIHVDENTIIEKGQSAAEFVDKFGREFGTGSNKGTETGHELQAQHGILRDCFKQLKASELLRTSLLASLREAVNDQECKIKRLRDELQVLQSRYRESGVLCEKMGLEVERKLPPASQGLNGASSNISVATTKPPPVAPGAKEENEAPISEAAVVAMDLSPTALANTVTAVFTSMMSDATVTQTVSQDQPSGSKRMKTDNGDVQPHPPPFPYPDEHVPPPPLYPPSPQPASNSMIPPLMQMTPVSLVTPMPMPPVNSPMYPPLPPGVLHPMAPAPPGMFGFGSPVYCPPPPNFPLQGMPPFNAPLSGPPNAFPSYPPPPDGGMMNGASNFYPGYAAPDGGHLPPLYMQ